MVHLMDPDLFIKMELMEGEDYVKATKKQAVRWCQGRLDRIADAQNISYSILEAFFYLDEAIEKVDEAMEEYPDEEWEVTFDAPNNYIIYGNGGWHRYYVTPTGNVAYSYSHGKAHVQDALDLGFEVW